MKKYAKYIYIISMIIVLGVTVGYAAVISETSISNIVAEIRTQKDIRITEVTLVPEQTSNTISNDLNYGINSITANATFNNQTSYITYKVKVTNIGNVDMGIAEITGLPDNINYELVNYTLKDKICDSNYNCNSGISKEFYIKIFPTDNNTQIKTYDMKIKFNFEQFWTISYENIANNNYPTEILNSDNLSITFTGDTPQKIYIFLNNEKLDSSLYTYSNNKVTYNNVTGNIKISSPTTFKILMQKTAISDADVDFSLPPTSGIYMISDTQKYANPIYYYRGAVLNNNVLFANFCWKAVRTTETGGVKLIYNGVPASDGSCNNTGEASQLATKSIFNVNNMSASDVRYIYENGADSTIKGVIDKWYEENMIPYTSSLEDIGWCSDLNEVNPTMYAPYERNLITYEPSVNCPTEYQMKVSATSMGNKLKYPVALLTLDEATLAGSGYENNYSEDAYLNTGQGTWLLSPTHIASGAHPMTSSIYNSGIGGMQPVAAEELGIRPSVSLAPGTEIIQGNGTFQKPYKVFEPESIISKMKEKSKSDVSIDFGVPEGSGIYMIEDTKNKTNPIYYYRGEIENNNVLFAGLCWKIVRTTETGGIKLIYNGTATGKQCNGTNPTIGDSAFNTKYSTTSDVRYIYENGTNSTVKGVVDAWYEANMTSYTKDLEDTGWCMDLSLYTTGNNETYYGAFRRNFETFDPSVNCPAEYEMKVSSTMVGNKLKYPVAMLTADEATLAGAGYRGFAGYSYLNTESFWWTLSPFYFLNSGFAFNLSISGTAIQRCVYEIFSVRPSVSLAPGTVIIEGNGSKQSPYITSYTSSPVTVPTLVTFKIGSVIYQAEEGMTLLEWTESSYNTAAFIHRNGYILENSGSNKVIYASPSDIIDNEVSFNLGVIV